tara:strand:- start:84 stop:437 length:354 start_codon:yes stop_codon:yes gene_type:complete
MDRNRDLAVQIVNLQKRIDEQMDLDYARHGSTLIIEGYTTEITGSFYGIKADGLGTTGLVINAMTVDGVSITDNITIANGDVFYGNITAITVDTSGGANGILLHKKGHGPTVVLGGA